MREQEQGAADIIQHPKDNNFFTDIEDGATKNEAINSELLFVPNWNNKPQEKPPVIKLNGIGILGYQNTTAIIAAPGSGKSAVCEAVAASFLNNGADCLGFKVAEDCTGVIYIDFERSSNDVWNSFYRMCRRADIKEGAIINNVLIAGMRAIPRLVERKQAINYLLENYPCSLLILDGAGDMVTDTNDLPEAIECRIFLRQITVDYQLSILTTLHPNPNSFKPRGHIGSEVMREADSVLVIKKVENDCRIITTDFEHGKNRNEGHAESAFNWSVEKKMFISIDLAEIKNEKALQKEVAKADAAIFIVKAVFKLGKQLTYTQAYEAIAQETGKAERTAKALLKSFTEYGLIEKLDTGKYQLKEVVQQCKTVPNEVQIAFALDV